MGTGHWAREEHLAGNQPTRIRMPGYPAFQVVAGYSQLLLDDPDISRYLFALVLSQLDD